RNQRGGPVSCRKETASDDRREIAVDAEIVPFHDIAGDAGDDSAALSANCLLIHPSLTKRAPDHIGSSFPRSAGLSGKILQRNRREFRLGRACTGHPRLRASETKAWIRGSSPRKTT